MNRLATKPTKWSVCPVWSVFAGRMKKPWVLSYPLSAQQRLWSDRADQMPRLIWVFAGRTCHFVGFVMRQLKYPFFMSARIFQTETYKVCFSSQIDTNINNERNKSDHGKFVPCQSQFTQLDVWFLWPVGEWKKRCFILKPKTKYRPLPLCRLCVSRYYHLCRIDFHSLHFFSIYLCISTPAMSKTVNMKQLVGDFSCPGRIFYSEPKL